jgi:hypothetical protein
MKCVPLPKGTFYMGWNGQESSAKKTEIKEDFEIAIHTVTQEQWEKVMGKNPCYFSRDGKGKDRVKDIKDEELKQFPVESVQVKAGLVGEAPKLLDLEDGDLKVTTDFRRVYASVIENWLGLPSKTALGGDFDRLPLFRS